MKRYLQFSLIILSIALLLSAAGALSLLQLGGYVPFWIWATLGFNFLVSIALFLLAYSVYGDNKRKAVPKREKIMVPKQPVARQRIEKPKVTVVKTVVAASGTRSEKLEALRNAVLNPASSPLVDEDVQNVFLNFVDELTPWHLRVLKFLDNPEEWFRLSAIPVPKKALGTAWSVLFAAFPELEKRKAFAKQLSRDLSRRGLASDWESMDIVTGRSGMFASQTTSLGKQFLEFVTFPVKKVKDNKT
jgi:hypothetical protein